MTDQAIQAAGHAGLCLAGRYRLEAVIATGGMGAVWSAEDTFLGRKVAVKILTWNATAERAEDAAAAAERAAERVRREARAAASLRHPAIACVYDYGHQDGLAFLVMELLDGESLATRLSREGALPPEEVVRVVAEVADALDTAHRAGIVHRDVKPGNIMLTASGEVKLLDFGIAAFSGQRSPPGQERLLGTAAYLSPEWGADAPADPASDVYALGVVVYEMLAGRPPFTGGSLAAVAAAHAVNPPPPLALFAPHAPAAMVAVCERALAKDPAARPPSAGAFAAQLSAALATPAPSATRVRGAPGAAPARPGEGSARPGAVPAWRLPAAAAARLGSATEPVWPPAAPNGGRRPSRAPARARPRWRALLLALTAALALAVVLQGTGALQDLLGAASRAGGPPATQAPAPDRPSATTPDDRGTLGGGDSRDAGDHGSESGGRSSDARSGDGGHGNDRRDRHDDDDDHSGPGHGGDS
jgi:eukaryotic-like serine/threonine-protein kinase